MSLVKKRLWRITSDLSHSLHLSLTTPLAIDRTTNNKRSTRLSTFYHTECVSPLSSWRSLRAPASPPPVFTPTGTTAHPQLREFLSLVPRGSTKTLRRFRTTLGRSRPTNPNLPPDGTLLQLLQNAAKLLTFVKACPRCKGLKRCQAATLGMHARMQIARDPGPILTTTGSSSSSGQFVSHK